MLSNPTKLLTGGIWLLLGILCLMELISYFRWHAKAKIAAEHGEFLNRWRLFCLKFSFIGWSILSSFTLGIGHLCGTE